MMPTTSPTYRQHIHAGFSSAWRRYFLHRVGPRLLHCLVLLSILSSLIGVPSASASAETLPVEQQAND